MKKDYSRTEEVASEMERLLADETDSDIVAEARKRAEALTANPPYPGYQGSVRTELAFLIWQRAGMPLHPSEGGKVIVAPADFPFLPDDIMEQINISYPSIRRLASEMESAGCAKKIGNRWFFSDAAFAWLRERPDKAQREIKVLRGTTLEGGKCTLKRLADGKVQRGCSGLNQEQFDAYAKASGVSDTLNGGDWEKARNILADAGFQVFAE